LLDSMGKTTAVVELIKRIYIPHLLDSMYKLPEDANNDVLIYIPHWLDSMGLVILLITLRKAYLQ